MYLLTGELTEYAAHLPFAFASWVGVLATYLLGRRWFGPVAGWWAGAMVAVDGYLMAFGRMLQYQSLIFLLTVLVVIVMQRAVDRHRSATRYLFVAALLLATGLLYHYEAIIGLLPATWLLFELGRRQRGHWWAKMGQVVRQLALPLLAGLALLAAFYVPFVLDPEFFRDTYYYIFDYRLAGHTVPEGLAVIAGRSTLYSSSYYFWTLVVLTVVGLHWLYRAQLSRRLRLPFTSLLIAVLAMMVLEPVAFAAAPWRLAPLLVTILFLPAWLAPPVPAAQRAGWLWFGVTMIGVLFFVRKPGTHVYVFFIPWALVTGLVIGQLWDRVEHWWGMRAQRYLLAPLLVLLTLIFGNYVYQLFVKNEVEVLRTWDEHRPAGYWTSYDSPTFESIFGFPIRNGWQTVAVLYDQGVLNGRFDTNDRFSMVPDWYLRGQEYCPRDEGKYYLLVPYPLAADRPVVDEQRRALADDYFLWGTVTTNGAPHMEIYQKRDAADADPTQAPFELRSAEYEGFFTQHLLAPFTRNGPLGAQPIPNPTEIRFGDVIALRGYALDRAAAKPGGEVEVTLYWSTTASLETNYFVSLQVIDLSDATKAGQRDGEPGCNRFPTTTWVPGDRIYDRYHVPIWPEARAGDYSIYLTVYGVAPDGSQTVLPVTLPSGEVTGGAVIGTITVAE
ncbi:MAG: glycosyltransferase family 39 protein [Caldilineaceae bacterium]